MRDSQIRGWVQGLIGSFGEPRRPVDPGPLRELYAQKKYAGMVAMVKSHLALDLKIRVGIYRSGGQKAPAWIEYSGSIPMFGTREFQEFRVTVCFRYDFVKEATFEAVVLAIAHELSHIVLDSVGHILSRQEEAVDLMSMLMGYSNFYLVGAHTETKRVNKSADVFLDLLRISDPGAREILSQEFATSRIASFGYLSKEEIRYAARLMRTESRK